jgi:hypothetical protein
VEKTKWTKQTVKALGGHNIIVECEVLNRQYCEPRISFVVRATDTGHLELVKISARNPSLPSFSIRWDQADNSIDVDLLGDANEARKFAMQKGGYRGHKTVLTSKTPRIYAVNINTPSTACVFRGTITLNIDLGVTLEDIATHVGMGADAVVIRNTAVMKPE